MSKSTRRTISDIEEDCGFKYGTKGFRAYVEQHGIDVANEKKRLKSEAVERRKRRLADQLSEVTRRSS